MPVGGRVPEHGQGLAGRAEDRQDVRHERGELGREIPQSTVQRLARGREVVVRREGGQLAQERADGEVGGPPGVGLGGTLGELRQAEMVAELVGEPGFADPGLAHQADGLTPPAAGALPGLAESRELGP